jgi:tetratricopeptide (TPR) repeat protein
MKTNRSSWTSSALVLAFFLCASAIGLSSAAAGPGAPDDGCLSDRDCRTHYDKAVALFEAGRFEAALPEFQAAYDRRQMPWLLINIGRTLHRLGRPREALDHYERFKAAESRPDAETTERLEKYIAQAKALAETNPTPIGVQPAATPGTTPTAAAGSETPLYKKWWFWTAIGGGVVLVAVIAGAAAGASRPSGNGLPDGVMTVKVTF